MEDHEVGRDAKYYSPPKAGRQQLEEGRAGRRRLYEAISLVLDFTE